MTQTLPVVPLRQANWGLLRQRLEIELEDRCRTVWVQRSNNGSSVTVLVTTFDREGTYMMHFGRHVRNFNYDSIRSLINI